MKKLILLLVFLEIYFCAFCQIIPQPIGIISPPGSSKIDLFYSGLTPYNFYLYDINEDITFDKIVFSGSYSAGSATCVHMNMAIYTPDGNKIYSEENGNLLIPYSKLTKLDYNLEHPVHLQKSKYYFVFIVSNKYSKTCSSNAANVNLMSYVVVNGFNTQVTTGYSYIHNFADNSGKFPDKIDFNLTGYPPRRTTAPHSAVDYSKYWITSTIYLQPMIILMPTNSFGN